METVNYENWKIIPNMERYIINKDGEIRNRFTKKVIFPRKDRNLIHLTADNGDRITRSPDKLAKQLWSQHATK